MMPIRRAITIAATFIWMLLLAALVYLALFGWGLAEWSEDLVRDEATDAVTYNFWHVSDDGDSRLRLTCRPNARIAVILVPDSSLGGAGANAGIRAVRLRFDDEAPIERPALIGDEGLLVVAASDPRSSDLVSRLAASRRLEITLDAAGREGPLQARFHTVGADDVVADLRQNCI